MNGRLAKKIKKYSKRTWVEYFNAMCSWPFWSRLDVAWRILRAKKIEIG